MTRYLFVVLAGSALLVASPFASAGPAGRSSGVDAGSADASRALLDRYCVTCHNRRLKTASVVLEGLDPVQAGQDGELWERVVRKLRAGVMPPPGQPRPQPREYEQLSSYLESQLDGAATAHPKAGRTETLHRLNRAEYRNAVRDLLGLAVDVSELLPPDDASYGFDNAAGVLKINQMLLESYLSAAKHISRTAIGQAPPTPISDALNVPTDLPQYERNDNLPPGTRGGILLHYHFPQDAEYEFKVKLLCHNEATVDCDGSIGFRETYRLEVTIDGERVRLFTLPPRHLEMNLPGLPGVHAAYTNDGEIEPLEIRLPVKAGPRDIAVTFLQTAADREIVRGGFRKRFERPYRYYADAEAIVAPFVERVTINGPFSATGPGDTPSRRQIFSCRPASAAEEAGCARRIVAQLTRRAYRRPVAAADVDRLLTFYTAARSDGAGFEEGIESAIRALLVSPGFLLRVEREPAAAVAGSNYRINDLELASRLSFFLWSSIPDDELLNAAASGTLRTPAVLNRQVKRLLADPRSQALVENFAGQWLKLRNVAGTRPSEQLFPDFEESLRRAMRTETELFFGSIIREDRSVLELLTANYSFLNERLARHYGVPNVRGSEFRRVNYADDNQRRGLLGHGSILTVTSSPIRTSPVIRGKWIMENMLGVSPPPPPPNVPALPEPMGVDKRAAQGMRERMAQHRANPVCASCHAVIDPVGFALENFDAVGRWRDVDEVLKPIDASGRLPDGATFEGLAGFRAALMSHPERFVSVLIDRLLTYGLGRGLEYYDRPTVRSLLRDAARDDYRFSSIVIGIVNSLPFQMREAAPMLSGVSASRQ